MYHLLVHHIRSLPTETPGQRPPSPPDKDPPGQRPPGRNQEPGTETPEVTWDKAARQEVTSYRDPLLTE